MAAMKRDMKEWHRRFAWLPITTTDHVRVWLTWYEERMNGPLGLWVLYRRETRALRTGLEELKRG